MTSQAFYPKCLRERQPAAFGQAEDVVDEAGSIGHRESLVVFQQELAQRLPLFDRVVDAVVAELVAVELHPSGAFRNWAV